MMYVTSVEYFDPHQNEWAGVMSDYIEEGDSGSKRLSWPLMEIYNIGVTTSNQNQISSIVDLRI